MNTSKDIFDICLERVSQGFYGSTVIIPHVCNNVGSFGGGFTGSIEKRFPLVSKNFELLGKSPKLGYVQYVSVLKKEPYGHELIVANMIAQNGTISKKNPRPLNYEALTKSMIDVRSYVKSLDKEKVEIHCPKFGSGLAGGNWLFINDLIIDIWNKISVTVYSYPKNKYNVKSY
jgi:hypothetical protein